VAGDAQRDSPARRHPGCGELDDPAERTSTPLISAYFA